jgi:hypothetical protein
MVSAGSGARRVARHAIVALVRYPVLFPAASYDHVVLREAIGTEGVERFREDVTTIRLDGIEQRLAVDPAKPFKKVQ